MDPLGSKFTPYPHIILITLYGAAVLISIPPLATTMFVPAQLALPLSQIIIDHARRVLSVDVFGLSIVSFFAGLIYLALYDTCATLYSWIVKTLGDLFFPRYAAVVATGSDLVIGSGLPSVGSKQYAAFQVWLARHPAELAYRNWEWFIFVASRYLSFLVFVLGVMAITNRVVARVSLGYLPEAVPIAIRDALL